MVASVVLAVTLSMILNLLLKLCASRLKNP